MENQCVQVGFLAQAQLLDHELFKPNMTSHSPLLTTERKEVASEAQRRQLKPWDCSGGFIVREDEGLALGL